MDFSRLPFRRLASVFAMCCACVGAGGQQLRDVAYGPAPRHRLDLCWPTSEAGPFPAVLLIHGGGWVSGDKADVGWLCRYFAERGIVAAAVGYRLADGSTANAWPAQLVDAQLAARWLRAHARDLRIDPAHICALGDSAGGQLATWLAVEKSIHPGDYAGVLANVSPAVACAVDNFAPLLFEKPPYDAIAARLLPPGAAGSDMSPLPKISGATAPMLVVHGRQDEIAPLAHSRGLAAALARAHVPAALIIFEGGHEFQGVSATTRERILAAEAAFVRDAGSCPQTTAAGNCDWLAGDDEF